MQRQCQRRLDKLESVFILDNPLEPLIDLAARRVEARVEERAHDVKAGAVLGGRLVRVHEIGVLCTDGLHEVLVARVGDVALVQLAAHAAPLHGLLVVHHLALVELADLLA